MKDDTREELARIEKELLDDEAQVDALLDALLSEDAADISMDETMVVELPPEETLDVNTPLEDILGDALVSKVLSEPAFEDPDTIHEPAEPLVYCNFSNDYGRDLPDSVEYGEQEQPKKPNDDKVTIGLMITASALCLGIVGVLIYWLAAYL